jgi:hypothetical protein
MDVDWHGFETEFTAELQGFARGILARAERTYAVAVYLFYAETCGRIMLPVFAAATEEWFDKHLAADREQAPGSPGPSAEMRWNPADWPHQHYDIDWARHGAYWAWSKALTDAASGPGVWESDPDLSGDDEARWQAVHDRYLDVVTRACRSTAAVLRREPAAREDLVVVALDDDAELVPRTLTDTEIRRHLPHLHHAQDT